MKLVLILFCFVLSTLIHAQPVNCEGAPSDAKIELPSPIDKWAVIFCSPHGHVFAAIDGTLWMTDKNTPFMFNANPQPSANSTLHSAYFYKIIRRSLTGQSKLNANKVLAISTFVEDQTLQPWQVDLRSSENIRYSVFFYLQEDQLKYVLGCKNGCITSVLLTPKSLEQLQHELK